MLQTLRVRNLALVEDVAVEFQPGLNVITGETGAGKSVLIGALGLLLGDRADRSLIRSGADQCVAEAQFVLGDPSAVDAVLEEMGLPPCENGQLVVRRTLTSAGASRNLVNDSATTIQTLKRLGELLVDMHGPYDHQSLLNTDFQLDVLDAFGHLWEPRETYEKAYGRWRELVAQRKEWEGTSDQDVQQQIELLTYQKKEIEDAAPVEGEDEAVVREQTEVANAQRIMQLADGVRGALVDGDQSAFAGIAAAQKALNELAGVLEEARQWREEARLVAVQVQDLAESIDRRVRHIEADPRRLEWLEERMGIYHRLKRKYGATIPDILARLERIREQLRGLETRGQRLAEIDTGIAEGFRQVERSGAALGKTRRQVASRLGKAITSELRDLGFAHGVFAVVLEAHEPSASGLDGIEFTFAPNAGEPPRPLRAIASSGEISRVMLAIKSVLASHDRIPVLVFDEIDANVGGVMGNAIGRKLEVAAQHHQVLCITHLPQVAVHGNAQYAVIKEVVEKRTRTRIVPVDGEARVEEIARMLGGRDLTSVTLKHAREMLQQR